MNFSTDDLKDLQQRTLKSVIAGAAILTGFLLYINIVIISSKSYDFNGFIYGLVATLMLGLVTWASWHLQKQNKTHTATLLLLGGGIVAINISLLIPQSFQLFNPYLFLIIIVVSGTLLNPEAPLKIAVICIISAIIVIGFAHGFNTSVFRWLIAPGILTVVLALATWGSAETIITTTRWAIENQHKVATRRDELFESQQALQKAYELLETTNIRLTESQKETQEANETKTRFLNNLSHELRTPLNAIINFAFILSHNRFGELNADQNDYLNRIQKAGEHLLGIVNDLLDFAKIEANQLELFLEDVDLHETIPVVLDLVDGLIGDKPVMLTSDLPENLPLVTADTARLRQILFNLLSNAAKYTDEGYILLKAEVLNDEIVISIEDTGIGIKEDDFELIFKEFRQAEEVLMKRRMGTGLGLPISKRFIEMHGGKIWLESKWKVGSTFYFSLPLSKSEPKTLESEPVSSYPTV